MKNFHYFSTAVPAALLAILACTPAAADLLSLSQTPLFLTSNETPNVLVILDNSQSMDATMSGTLIAGDDAVTRGNIGRGVMRDTITNYRTSFDWGLMSFGLSGGTTRYNTYAYFLGDADSMLFTDDCVSTNGLSVSGVNPGISASNGGLRCVPNPQPFTGGNYVTYEKSGDDPDVNDVLYTDWTYSQLWGLSPGVGYGTTYHLYTGHKTSWGDSWSSNAFSGSLGNVSFTPTDAGYLPSNPPITRQLYLQRAWGYLSNISGKGHLDEPVKDDSTSHYNNLMSALASETGNTSTDEIKNAAVYTPLAGTLASAKKYFSGDYSGQDSPITAMCQKNFVMLVTDGLPTGTSSGGLYSDAARVNTYDASTGTWTFGQAATDTIDSVTALRSTVKGASTFDIPTYVVALSNTLANPTGMAVMNAMAKAGGTGTAYLATNKAAFQSAVQNIARDIAARTASASAVALNSGTWSTNTTLYQARFNSGNWSGQLLAYAVNADGTLAPDPIDAGQVVDTQNWDTGRNIFTYKPSAALGSRGIDFRWPADAAAPTASELDPSEITDLNEDAGGVADGNGEKRLDYLRGDDTYEAAGSTPQFRPRPTSKLGDIIDSTPYYVGAPSFNYPDTMESVPYSTFASTYKNRRKMIYAGANDGMLHAFDATTMQEVFAYVPSAVYPYLSQLTATPYTHRYYVDGSPTVGDAFYDDAWHTLLVGGLRAGGQAIYTLDITDPTTFTESGTGPQKVVRWEFTDADDSDLGYTFSQPSIVKMNNGRWAVIIGNGYDSTQADGHASTTGHGVIYVLDAETGAILKKFDTQTGSTTSPDGVATPTPIDTNGDGITDVIYAGDLFGNLWKLDVSATNANSWDFALKAGNKPEALFSTSQRTGLDQPITERPDVMKNPDGGYMIFFGTGRYIDTRDNSTTGTQSFYGIKDNDPKSPIKLSDLQKQTIISSTAVGADGNTYRLTSHAVGVPNPPPTYTGADDLTSTTAYQSEGGWYIDLPEGAERQVNDPIVHGDRIIFTTLIPDTTECNFGGSGWLMELDALTGNRLDYSVLDVNGDNTINPQDTIAYADENYTPSGRKISTIPASPGILQQQQTLGSQQVENKYISTSSGAIERVKESGGHDAVGRISWQQLK